MKKAKVTKLKKAIEKLEIAESNLHKQKQRVELAIEELTGVKGIIDHLSGDGFGFDPSNEEFAVNTHVSLGQFLKWAENGTEITYQLIIDNCSF